MEQQGEEQVEPEGDRYLRLLGLEHRADELIHSKQGMIPARDFLEVCGAHARPVLVGFETMKSDDPQYGAVRAVLQKMINGYIDGNPQP